MRRLFIIVIVGIYACSVAAHGARVRAVNSSELSRTEQEVPSSSAAKLGTPQKTEDEPSSPAATKADYSKEPFVVENRVVENRT